MKKILFLSLLCLPSLKTLHAEEKKFVADAYTHAENEVEPTDWKNPDVKWCSDLSKLRVNCLRLIPSEAKKITEANVEWLSIPFRSHLYYKDMLDGTLWYYGNVLFNPLTSEIKVVIDSSKTKYSQWWWFAAPVRWSTDLDEPKTYAPKMETLLKGYFDKSVFFKNLLNTRENLLKFIKEIFEKVNGVPAVNKSN